MHHRGAGTGFSITLPSLKKWIPGKVVFLTNSKPYFLAVMSCWCSASVCVAPFCVENHDINTDQLWYGVRLLAEKQATNFGDGESLILFMRDAIGEYHQQGKVICWWFLWLFVVVWFGAFWNILVFSGEVQAWVCVEGPTSRGGVWWKDSCGL